MKLPAAVRIGPYPCKITRIGPDADVFGTFDSDTFGIEMAPEGSFSSEVQEAATLIHEMVHGIVRIYKIKVPDEEALVEILDTALVQILRDNKTLFRSILKALK